MTLKEKRKEIYDFINSSVGELSPESQSDIKKLLNEYSEISKETISSTLKLENISFKEKNKYLAEELNKLREKKGLGYFNYDFIQK